MMKILAFPVALWPHLTPNSSVLSSSAGPALGAERVQTEARLWGKFDVRPVGVQQEGERRHSCAWGAAHAFL